MPSLWKRSNSKYWTCCYTAADGRQLKKSTKKEGRSDAWEFCLALERAENLAKDGALTEQTAKKLIGEVLERVTGTPLQNLKTGEWLDQWLAAKEQVRADKTGERYKQVVRDLKASLGSRAKLPLGHIAPKDIFTFRQSILTAGHAPRTANLSVKIVSAAFSAAVRLGYITSNPCTALESLAVESAEKGTFTTVQVGKLVAAAEGDWKGAVLLGYFTGARLRDVANMRWESVDLAKRLLTFTAGKTKKPLTIPLHADLEAFLMQAPGVGKAFLFPALAGKGTGGAHGLSGRFSAIVTRAGIETATSKTGTRAQSSLTYHSLRHSFNSAMANAGVSQEVRQKLTGHASAEVNKLYTHHELEPLRAAIELLPKLAAK